jgi:outer membrane protein
VKKNFIVPVLGLAAALSALAQATPLTKIGVIQVQEAIRSTKDGRKAANELQDKFALRKSELEKEQAEINSLQDQLRTGSATLNDEAKNKLMREIDSKTTSLKRETEDFQSDVQEEGGKVTRELGAKLMKVVSRYAADNGFAVILDVSNPRTSVLWTAATANITADIIALYDKANPPSAAPAAAPAAPVTRSTAPLRTPVAPSPAPRKQ